MLVGANTRVFPMMHNQALPPSLAPLDFFQQRLSTDFFVSIGLPQLVKSQFQVHGLGRRDPESYQLHPLGPLASAVLLSAVTQ